MRLADDIRDAYEREIVAADRELQFVVLIAFLLTFVIVRTLTHAIRDGRGPFRNISVGSTHIHHLVPGIVLLLVSGYLGLALQETSHLRIVAALFGVGAALTLDEFALWLHLEDVYWAEQGRQSIDAVIIVGSLAALVLVGRGFWVGVAHGVRDVVGSVVGLE